MFPNADTTKLDEFGQPPKRYDLLDQAPFAALVPAAEELLGVCGARRLEGVASDLDDFLRTCVGMKDEERLFTMGQLASWCQAKNQFPLPALLCFVCAVRAQKHRIYHPNEDPTNDDADEEEEPPEIKSDGLKGTRLCQKWLEDAQQEVIQQHRTCVEAEEKVWGVTNSAKTHAGDEPTSPAGMSPTRLQELKEWAPHLETIKRMLEYQDQLLAANTADALVSCVMLAAVWCATVEETTGFRRIVLQTPNNKKGIIIDVASTLQRAHNTKVANGGEPLVVVQYLLAEAGQDDESTLRPHLSATNHSHIWPRVLAFHVTDSQLRTLQDHLRVNRASISADDADCIYSQRCLPYFTRYTSRWHRSVLLPFQLAREAQEASRVAPQADPTTDAQDASTPPGPKSCVVCGVQSKTACSRCHVARYCSRDHQKQHWAQHKGECKAFRRQAKFLPEKGSDWSAAVAVRCCQQASVGLERTNKPLLFLGVALAETDDAIIARRLHLGGHAVSLMEALPGVTSKQTSLAIKKLAMSAFFNPVVLCNLATVMVPERSRDDMDGLRADFMVGDSLGPLMQLPPGSAVPFLTSAGCATDSMLWEIAAMVKLRQVMLTDAPAAALAKKLLPSM